MKNDKVSVIIPCYNYGRFLGDSVQSVISQTHRNWECLIIDDGSTDNTKEESNRLVKADSRIKYYYKTNGGLSSARNYGIEKSQGAFVSFLDADDLYDKNKLEEQLNAFSENPDADIVYGNAMFFEKNNPQQLYNNKHKDKHAELSKYSGQGPALISLLNYKNITVVSAPLVKMDVFNKVGTFSENYKSYEDWHFWMRCALANCSFVYCEKPAVCTYIRFGHESMMSDKKKLIRAAVQLRQFLASRLPLRDKPYNYYRLVRSQLKLLLSR